MDPLRTLAHEHRVIERALDRLEQLTDRIGVDGPVVGIADLVEFLRGYGDGLHHAKEEEILFAAIEHGAGLPPGAGPVSALRAEHDRERELVGAMEAALAGVAEGEPEARRRLVRACRSYIELVRHHIQKEDRIFYRMARRRLPEAVLARVVDELEVTRAAQADAAESLLNLLERVAHVA